MDLWDSVFLLEAAKTCVVNWTMLNCRLTLRFDPLISKFLGLTNMYSVYSYKMIKQKSPKPDTKEITLEAKFDTVKEARAFCEGKSQHYVEIPRDEV